VLANVPGIGLGTAFVLVAVMISQLQQAYVQLETSDVEAAARMMTDVLAASVGPLFRGDDVAGAQRLWDDLARSSPTVHPVRVRHSRDRFAEPKATDDSEAKPVQATVPPPEFEVVGEATDGVVVLEQRGRLVPDVVLMDLTMPGLGGIGATHEVCRPGQAIPTSRLALGWPRRRRKEGKPRA
jgi:CheY-like chemotaxis protein